MAEMVAFPTDAALPPSPVLDGRDGDSFLLDEGLELLADYRAISDRDVRASLRAMVKSIARLCAPSSV